MESLLDVVSVEARKDNTLLLVFDNQEKRLFDMTAYLEKKPFSKLKESSKFMKAFIAYGTVVWPGNIDIAPETLWEKSYKYI